MTAQATDDQRAWYLEQLVDHIPRLRSSARRLAHDVGLDPDEALAGMFERALHASSVAKFDRESYPDPWPWFLQQLRWSVADLERKRGRYNSRHTAFTAKAEAVATTPGPEARVDALAADIWIATRTPYERAIMKRHFELGWSLREIASLFGKSKSTIGRDLERLHDGLRRALFAKEER